MPVIVLSTARVAALMIVLVALFGSWMVRSFAERLHGEAWPPNATQRSITRPLQRLATRKATQGEHYAESRLIGPPNAIQASITWPGQRLATRNAIQASITRTLRRPQRLATDKATQASTTRSYLPAPAARGRGYPLTEPPTMPRTK
jgi:hypothetical protein